MAKHAGENKGPKGEQTSTRPLTPMAEKEKTQRRRWPNTPTNRREGEEPLRKLSAKKRCRWERHKQGRAASKKPPTPTAGKGDERRRPRSLRANRRVQGEEPPRETSAKKRRPAVLYLSVYQRYMEGPRPKTLTYNPQPIFAPIWPTNAEVSGY